MQNRSIESGVQLFSRMKNENSQAILDGINPKLFPNGGPFSNEVIEVVFSEGIDYTDFFSDFIVKAILPSRLCQEFKESQVILLHTDFQMNLFKIIKCMEKKLEQCNVKAEEKKSIVEAALINLITLNCFTKEQLEITFYNLERIVNNCRMPSLVVLDNCLSQYWTEKFSNFMLSFDEYCIKIIDRLYEKVKDLNVVLIYGRIYKGENLRRGNQVGYSIHIIKNDQNFTADVTSLESDQKFSVPFNVNVCLEFS